MSEQISSNEKNGFTLIEIITSIALLTMIIAIMLPIFPQILNWSSQSEDNLTTSNLLGRVASDVKDKSESLPPLDSLPVCKEEGEVRTLSGKEFKELRSYKVDTDKYTVELNVCKEKIVDLYRTNFLIFSEQGDLLSESYTYVEEGGSG